MVNQQDLSFVQAAAQSNLAEITEGNIAVQHAAESSISAFGSRMITDHTAQPTRLTTAAANAGIPVPSTPNPAQQAEAAQLSTLSGRNFDRVYIEGQIAGHESTLAVLQQEVASGQDPGLVQVAQTAIPVVEDHLNMAEMLSAAEPKTLAGVVVQDRLVGIDQQTLLSDVFTFSQAQASNPLWWTASANQTYASPYDTLAFSGGANQLIALNHQG